MRIIKLSQKDVDFPDRASVAVYFKEKLQRTSPTGQFLLTSGRIASDGIESGELLIFSYCTEIVYLAKAGSGRLQNDGNDKQAYPFYFCIDLSTLVEGKGNLGELEDSLAACSSLGKKNIVATRGWPCFPDSKEVEAVWQHLKR